MTNATFNFETSPNTKPKEKNVGGTWRSILHGLKKVRETRPPPNCAHEGVASEKSVN